jgi:hypothetical protein
MDSKKREFPIHLVILALELIVLPAMVTAAYWIGRAGGLP